MSASVAITFMPVPEGRILAAGIGREDNTKDEVPDVLILALTHPRPAFEPEMFWSLTNTLASSVIEELQ